MVRKIVFSALQPTGTLTIGNYIGAVVNMARLQDEYDCYYSVADLHTITVDIKPQTLKANSYDLYAMLLALGIKDSTLFLQSHVPEHSQLAWVLNCHTQMGEAKRMTQFKDKSAKNPKNINVGLFAYPVLMAADILLYGAHNVPIGKDQKQHLELARVVAQRFNSKYGETFVVPDGIMPKYGAKINSLLDPNAKMSKSADDAGTVFLTDSDDEIMRKFKRAVTDSGSEVKYDRTQKAGISNLITIYSSFASKSIAATEKEFEGLRYGDFKKRTAEAVIEKLKPIKAEFNRLRADEAYLKATMKQNAQKASEKATQTIKKVYQTCGLICE